MTAPIVNDPTAQVQAILDPDHCGDSEAFNALIKRSCQRLHRLVHQMLHRHFSDLRRWEDTDDVLQQSLLRLHGSLKKIRPRSVREFYGLVTKQILWELIDLCRHYFGPQGLGANHESDFARGRAVARLPPRRELADDTDGPPALLAWAEFHEQAGRLPEEEREVFDLLWYLQLAQADAAAVLGVSLRTVKRRWQRAKVQLHQACFLQPSTETD